MSSARSWFATFTFRDVEVSAYSDFQKYIKRLRKSGAAIAYVCVEEFGKRNGRYHLHSLMFERRPLSRTSRDARELLRKHWKHGITDFAPLTPLRVGYALKYLRKDAGRLRHSNGIGRVTVGNLKKQPSIKYAAEVFGSVRLVSLADRRSGTKVRFHSFLKDEERDVDPERQVPEVRGSIDATHAPPDGPHVGGREAPSECEAGGSLTADRDLLARAWLRGDMETIERLTSVETESDRRVSVWNVCGSEI